MEIMTHAKFHFNRLMLTLIFGVWASEPPLLPGERLKRPDLIGSSHFYLVCKNHRHLHMLVPGDINPIMTIPVSELS